MVLHSEHFGENVLKKNSQDSRIVLEGLWTATWHTTDETTINHLTRDCRCNRLIYTLLDIRTHTLTRIPIHTKRTTINHARAPNGLILGGVLVLRDAMSSRILSIKRYMYIYMVNGVSSVWTSPTQKRAPNRCLRNWQTDIGLQFEKKITPIYAIFVWISVSRMYNYNRQTDELGSVISLFARARVQDMGVVGSTLDWVTNDALEVGLIESDIYTISKGGRLIIP